MQVYHGRSIIIFSALSIHCLTNLFLFPNHQANGLDERWNQTMKKMLVKYTWTRKETWDAHLDSCVFAYNITAGIYPLLTFWGYVWSAGSASHRSRHWQRRTKQITWCLPWGTTGKYWHCIHWHQHIIIIHILFQQNTLLLADLICSQKWRRTSWLHRKSKSRHTIGSMQTRHNFV